MNDIQQKGLVKKRSLHTIDDISLNSINSIKVLIKFKKKYEIMFDNKCYADANDIENTESFDSYELINVIYLDLDNLIKKAKLDSLELKIITYLMNGYSESDISTYLGHKLITVNKMFYKICEKIQQANT